MMTQTCLASLVAAVLVSADFAYAQNDGEQYWPGLRVWAPSHRINGEHVTHGKWVVREVQGAKILLEEYPYHKLEPLAVLDDVTLTGFRVPNKPEDMTEHRTKWFLRAELDPLNDGRFEIFVPYKGQIWPKAQIVAPDGPDAFKVQIFDQAGRPSEVVSVPRSEILKYNVPVYPADGESIGWGLKANYSDPAVQAAIERLNVVAERPMNPKDPMSVTYRQAIEGAADVGHRAAAQKALAYAMFAEYKRFGIEHDGNLIDEADSLRHTSDKLHPELQTANAELKSIADRHLQTIQGIQDAAKRTKAIEAMYAELAASEVRLNPEGKLVLADYPTGSQRSQLQSSDPAGRSLGSMLRGKVAECTTQAATYVGLMARTVAPELGIHVQRISTYHGEVLIRFGDGSRWVQDMTGSRGKPTRGRNFASLTDTAGKPIEMGWNGGPYGLGSAGNLSRVSVDDPWSPGKAIPKRLALTNEARVVTDLTPDAGKFDRPTLGARARHEAVAAGSFVAAYLAKEALKAIEKRDADALKEAAAQLGTLRFWRDLGLFTVTARATQWGLGPLVKPGSLPHAALPLALGMAAVSKASGSFSADEIIVDTFAYLTTGYGVNFIADSLIRPLLFRTAPGLLAGFAYDVAKMTLTLYGGEKFGAWLRWVFRDPRQRTLETAEREGAVQKVAALSATSQE